MLNKLLKILLVLDLVAVNLLLGYLVYRSSQFKAAEMPSNEVTKNEVTYVDQCGEECQKYISDKVAELQSDKVVTPKPTAKPGIAKVKTRREEVLTIPGEGSGSTMDWIDITATNFYFDTKDYPGLTEVYFEAKMKLLNGNGYGYVRLYDVTNGIAINGSENNTNSQSEVWTKSQKVYFWAGKNLVRVQAKSLTVDTVVYTQGRLRIVTEN